MVRQKEQKTVYFNHLSKAMLFSGKTLFNAESSRLAPYAIRSANSKGRKFQDYDDPYRTAFERDRDRVVHSKAFRRLSGKTQVFIASYGDHYRSRLTHSLEVSQVSRDIARALGLNEDLCEVIALAHDLGHTPFGHAGEEAMHEMMTRVGDTFEHNEQSRRIVEVLEIKSPEYRGLNLTFETLEGMMKHRSVHDDGKTPVIHSLEAQLVDLADAIAYHHHDLDDGIRSGILHYEELKSSLDLWRQAIEDLDFPSLGEALYRSTAINRIISLMINDVIEHSHQLLEDAQLTSPLSSPSAHPLIAFSPRMQLRIDQLAEYLGQTFYLHEEVTRHSAKGQAVVKGLFQIFSKRIDLIPKGLRDRFVDESPHVIIKDYIAGMTDDFALKMFQEYRDFR